MSDDEKFSDSLDSLNDPYNLAIALAATDPEEASQLAEWWESSVPETLKRLLLERRSEGLLLQDHLQF